jgi:hypothetical protein
VQGGNRKNAPEVSSGDRNVSSVKRRRREDFPTLEAPGRWREQGRKGKKGEVGEEVSDGSRKKVASDEREVVLLVLLSAMMLRTVELDAIEPSLVLTRSSPPTSEGRRLFSPSASRTSSGLLASSCVPSDLPAPSVRIEAGPPPLLSGEVKGKRTDDE